MPKSGPILAPLDGSQLSERSLPYAASFARARDRAVVLMIGAYASDIAEHGPWSDEMVSHPRQTCISYLEAARGRLAAAASVDLEKLRSAIPAPVEMKMLQGPHADALLIFAVSHAAGLVVMTPRARAGLQRAAPGSTADRVTHGQAPVLLIRPAGPTER